MLSIILPAFNEESNIRLIISKITNVLTEHAIDFEILFVNDGSTDGTWQQIISQNDPRIRGVSFTRNFGKESAIFAGLENCSGDCAIVLDADLQHPVDRIIEMYLLWENGYQIIEGVKKIRGKEGFAGKVFARFFYFLFSRTIGTDMRNSSDFKLLDRKVIDVITAIKEKNTFFRALTYWTGFKSINIEYEVLERVDGSSKWSKKQLLKYALNNITSFSAAPLYAVFFVGLVFTVFAAILAIQTFVNWITGGANSGFTTVILLLVIIGSVIILSLGIIGIYISRIFEEVKQRPRYLVDQKKGLKKEP